MPRCKGFNNNGMRCKKLTNNEYCSSHTPSQYVCQHIVSGERKCKLPANNSELCLRHCPVDKELYDIYADMNFDAVNEFKCLKEEIHNSINVKNLDVKNIGELILSYINPIHEKDFYDVNDILYHLTDEFVTIHKIGYVNSQEMGWWKSVTCFNSHIYTCDKKLIFCPYRLNLHEVINIRKKIKSILIYYLKILEENEKFFHKQPQNNIEEIGIDLKESKTKIVNLLLSLAIFLNLDKENFELLQLFFEEMNPESEHYKVLWNRKSKRTEWIYSI